MSQGQRLVFNGPRQVVLESFEIGAPGGGQVLLKTERTLISTGTELTALTGDFPAGSVWASYIQYPWVPGYSSVATVAALGAEVSSVAVGDRVISWAAHASHAIVSADRLWKVPAAVASETASFATIVEIVMGGVRRSRVAFGESVVVVGAGLLGQVAAHLCRIAGAWPVMVVDPAGARLPLAKSMGATHTVALPAADAVAAVQEATHSRLADVVIEVTGDPRAIVGAVRLARKLGRVVLLGSPRGPVTIDLHDQVHSLSQELIGAHNSAHPPAETPNTPWTIGRDVELFLEWQAAGVMDVGPLITHRYAWRQGPEAFQMLLEDRSRALGVVLDWSA